MSAVAAYPTNVYPDPVRRDVDPSTFGFDPRLPIEIALKTAPLPAICEAYGLDRESFAELACNPLFIKAYEEAVIEVKKDGVTFRKKAQLQADALLNKSWEIIHADGTPSAVKADLIKSTVRWAGWDSKPGEGVAGAQFAIQINL